MKTEKVMRKNQVKKTKNPREAWWILEGDWGGQVYATIPVCLVGFAEGSLSNLLQTIDGKCWPGNKGLGASLYVETGKVGDSVPGGMGGGKLEEGVWVHSSIRTRLQLVLKAWVYAAAHCWVCGLSQILGNERGSLVTLCAVIGGEPPPIMPEELPAGWRCKDAGRCTGILLPRPPAGRNPLNRRPAALGVHGSNALHLNLGKLFRRFRWGEPRALQKFNKEDL